MLKDGAQKSSLWAVFLLIHKRITISLAGNRAFILITSAHDIFFGISLSVLDNPTA